MKIKYLWPLLIVLSGCMGSSKMNSDLEYTLGFVSGNRVHVKLVYHPLEADSVKFTYGEPMYGGQTDIIKGLNGLKVTGGKMNFNPSAREMSLYYRYGRAVIIEYDITDTHTTEMGTRGELFRPLIFDDYFYCHGINLFLNPLFRDKNIKATQSVSWEKLPAFSLFQAYDPGNDGTTVSTGKQADFKYKLITGAKDMTVEKIKVDGTENYLVLRISKDKELNTKEITGYFEKFYSAIRRFWKDTTTQSYSLILQPFLAVNHSISGMSFGSGFLGKYTYKADTILNPERIFVLSHEIGHHWFGGKIGAEDKDQWFEEGFNDYLTFYTLLMTGYMTPMEFEKKFNTVLRSYYSSNVRNQPNDSVWSNYWKMGDYNKLPYWRGSIFAFYLDNKIRLASKGDKCFHDLCLSILEFCKTKGEEYKFSEDDFIEIASLYVGKKSISDDISKYVIKGEQIKFTNEMLVPVFGVAYKGDIPVISVKDEKEAAKLFH